MTRLSTLWSTLLLFFCGTVLIMASSMAGVLDENLSGKVNACRVLVVGAGGIGCELIKNLVLTGFIDIELVWNLLWCFITWCSRPAWLGGFRLRLRPLFPVQSCHLIGGWSVRPTAKASWSKCLPHKSKCPPQKSKCPP